MPVDILPIIEAISGKMQLQLVFWKLVPSFPNPGAHVFSYLGILGQVGITEPEHGMSEDKKKEKKEKKDPYSKTAQEKARLEAQQRLMGIDTNKKPKKKSKKKILGVKARLFRRLLVLNEVNYLFCFSCASPNLPMAIIVLQKETLKGMTFHENGPDVPIQSARRSADCKNVGDVLKKKGMDPCR